MTETKPAAARSSRHGDAGGPRRDPLPRTLAALSFWGAIALPGVYLPLLVFGLETPAGLATFLGLFGLHVLTLLAGHRHRLPVER